MGGTVAAARAPATGGWLASYRYGQPPMIGRERQTAIYLQGVSGRRPRVPLDPERLEAAARKAMRRDAFAYVKARRRHRGHRAREPRRLRPPPDRPADAARGRAPATRASSCSAAASTPVLLAPVGVLELAHREADVAVARAARRTGVPMIFSNQASRPMEECAQALGDEPALVPALLEHLGRARREPRRPRRGVRLRGDRADARHDDGRLAPARPRAGLPAVPARPGHRPVHERPGLPPPDGGRARAGPGRRSRLRRRRRCGTLVALTRAIPARSGATCGPATGAPPSSASPRSSRGRRSSWDDLPFLRERTKLPILLKGILHPDDARRALDAGVDGIVVSNHGGRQVDGAIATLDALPAVAAAVDGRVPVLLDSGVRTGADIFKALALGASAVLIGRAYVYGLARRRRGGRHGGARQPARGARPDDGAGRLRLARRGRARDARAGLDGDGGSQCSRWPLRCSPAAARSPSPSARDRGHRHGRPDAARRRTRRGDHGGASRARDGLHSGPPSPSPGPSTRRGSAVTLRGPAAAPRRSRSAPTAASAPGCASSSGARTASCSRAAPPACAPGRSTSRSRGSSRCSTSRPRPGACSPPSGSPARPG